MTIFGNVGARWIEHRFASVRGAAAALVVGVLWAHGASAQEPKAYTIANYPVQATAKDAVTAKKRAIADGQQAAFRSLLKRIVPVRAYSRLERVKATNAGDFLSSISVGSEQNSSTEYIASLDFIFSADATRLFLRQQGIPFIDEAAEVTTVVPVFKSAGGRSPVLGLGVWGKTWRGLDLGNTISPVRMAALKPTVHSDTLKTLEAGETSALRTVFAEYGSGPVVFAFAVSDVKAKRLNVMLVGRDGSGPLVLKRSYPLAPGDLAYAMEYAAVVSLGILEGRWKATRARSQGGIDAMSGPVVPLALQVQFQNPGQWYRIQEQLRGVAGVGDMRVAGVSARSADVALTFPGGGAQLANVLARQGMSLRDIGGVWILRPNY